MNLSIGEKIMIARHRKGLSRRVLGHNVYIKKNLKQLDYPDGRLKKIETGVISPENYIEHEIDLIAEALDVRPEELLGNNGDSGSGNVDKKNGTGISALALDAEFLKSYPKIADYISLLNATIKIDKSLCEHNFKRMAEYVQACSKE